jgi:hypothetical protein
VLLVHRNILTASNTDCLREDAYRISQRESQLFIVTARYAM